ncbi:golgin subfamily A member 2 [Eurosta solidaginis]|uniref:golgin subfamily A member 2 n=1 Tax=Eurosta solidaginis TaxID=178769 RepID=UPI003531677F
MPVEGKESKAQKLAAARKKLREYQKRGVLDSGTSVPATTESHTSSIAGGSSISSNISETSDCESSTNCLDVGSLSVVNSAIVTECVIESSTGLGSATEAETTDSATTEELPPPTAAIYFQAVQPTPEENVATTTIFDNLCTSESPPGPDVSFKDADAVSIDPVQNNVNTIQVLINEKATLTAELNKYRSLCRECELESEELRTQLEAMTQRQDDMLQRNQMQKQNLEQMRKSNAELQHKLAQANAKLEDQAAHMDELKRLLDVMQKRATDVEYQFKEKSNELEMAQLRIRQLSDEANVNQSDNRVEVLTQTQFMYEQQIRDLQAMVQQLTHDKEQANSQYQNYVQHLNAEMRSLNEKHSELMDEYTQQQDRERQLVDHISSLERDIQKNISRQDHFNKEKEVAPIKTEAHNEEIEKLKEKICDFEMERHEFQLKIKSQEDRLEQLQSELKEKHTKLEQFEEYMENHAAEQPDKTKLLATMESDKIAASRALTQNLELKKQLDELELRFVQLTNDKADLINKLDAEEHANRKFRENYATLEEKLHNIDERFKFKDEEMIRLSHENMELINKAMALERKLERQQQQRREPHKDVTVAGDYRLHESAVELSDHTGHDHNHKHGDQADSDKEDAEHKHNGYEDEEGHAHEHGSRYEHDRTFEQSQHYQDEGDHNHTHHHYHDQEHNEPIFNKKYSTSSSNTTSTPQLATEEAVEKLEQRFTRLMSQVADLTDEKQRLEHIVLQLQGETETIGEYITLYQTQRRMLKQREYEKAAQMQLLQREREQLRERIALLNHLVNSLSADLPQHRVPVPQHLNAMIADCNSAVSTINDNNANKADFVAEVREALEDVEPPEPKHINHQNEMQAQQKLSEAESRKILAKIQDIISEIDENTQHIPDVATTQTVDHLNCCLGKIEVV